MISLKTTLFVNGSSSGITGMALILFASPVSLLFGTSSLQPFVGAGIFLVVFAALVLYTAIKNYGNASLVKLITGLDILWVAGSALLLLLFHAQLSLVGIVAIAAVALWVALMAFLQRKGLEG